MDTFVITPRLPPAYGLPTDRPFTRAEAIAWGMTGPRLEHLVDQDFLRRPIRGVYVDAGLPDDLLLRCAVVALVVPDRAFVCDRTAAWIHVGDRALGPGEHLDVPRVSCFRQPGATRLRNGLTASGQRTIRDRDVTELGGLVVSTPLRTALDLGRLQRTRVLRLAGMDAMLSLRAFTQDELMGEIERFRGERGVVLLRALAPLADGGAESFGESALRLAWYDAGLPYPQTQVAAEGPHHEAWRIDLGLPGERFGAEYFGAKWHGPDQAEDDEARLAHLRNEENWTLSVFRKSNVFGRDQDADRRLRQAWLAHRARTPARSYL